MEICESWTLHYATVVKRKSLKRIFLTQFYLPRSIEILTFVGISKTLPKVFMT